MDQVIGGLQAGKPLCGPWGHGEQKLTTFLTDQGGDESQKPTGCLTHKSTGLGCFSRSFHACLGVPPLSPAPARESWFMKLLVSPGRDRAGTSYRSFTFPFCA